MKAVYWVGIVENKDDFGDEIKGTFIDGRTNLGPWAIMSPASFRRYGLGIGTGLGQKYQQQPDGRWLKIEG